MTQNPLLTSNHLLDFSAITADCVTPALDELLQNAQATLKEVTQDSTPATWEAVIAPLNEAQKRLSRAWGAVNHLMGVMDNEKLRAAYNENLPRVTLFSIEVAQNEALYKKVKALAASDAFKALTSEQQRAISFTLRDFRLSGAELEGDKKKAIKEINEKEAALSQKFTENLLDATNASVFDFENADELEGIPENALALYQAQAQSAGKKGYRITLQFPSYLPAMKYAKNRALREKLFRAYSMRASELGDEKLNNTPLINELLTLREKEAALLGFTDYASFSLETKMADSPEKVLAFLRDLGKRAKPYAEKDNEDLIRFAKDKLLLDDVKAWDRAYASEKLREASYSYSDEEVRQYFTLPTVFKGLFSLVEKLFSIRIKKASAPVWHPDVEFFRIEDLKGNLLAEFYTDLYARETKRGGAWMDNDLTREKLPDGRVETPIAYLVCNFSRPLNGKPTLLTHDEVTTLFHEFGHGLHHMLTKVDVESLSGINGVEWDAVEMPSQFMENWAWNYEIIQSITSHVDTKEAMPKELFDKLLAAKNFQSGLFCVRQLEFALFDMLIHTKGGMTNHDFMKTLKDVQKEVAVFKSPDFVRFPQSFSHIFAGGYAAGYYSYKWAEVLSADAFAAFEEEGLFNESTGKRWLSEVLSRGATRDTKENFMAFRGREPTLDALLRHTGMDKPL